MRGSILFGAAMLLSASGAAMAQERPICADRPGKASQACTVPAGHFQLETSLVDWTLDKNRGDRETVLAIGETGLKYGLADNAHVEITVTPWVRVASRGDGSRSRASGVGDVLVSYKHQLTALGARFQVALAPFVKVPTAKRPIGNGRWEGGFIAPIQYAIPKSPLVLSVTPEVDWNADSDGDGHHAAAASVANLGWQVTPKLNLSGEIWGQWDWDPDGTTKQVSADGAVAYLVNKDLQLDAGFNVGLNRATPDIDVYVGIARQF